MATIEKQLNELVGQKSNLENILKEKGVEIGERETFNTLIPKINELSGGGGLNIHFGDTAPEDTSMLWVKCDKPDNISISSRIIKDNGIFDIGSHMRANMGIAAVNNNIYIFGGRIGSDTSPSVTNTIYKFNAITNSCDAISTTLPKSLFGIGAVTVGTDIYLFGGTSRYEYDADHAINTIYKFDTITETITELSTVLPVKMVGVGCAAIGTTIYLFGGRINTHLDDSTIEDKASNNIYKFDTITETVTMLSTSIPVAISYMGIGVVEKNNSIYIFGGLLRSTNSGGASTPNIYKFNTISEEITKLSITLPTKNASMGVGVVGDKIYLMGGGDCAPMSNGINSSTYKSLRYNNILEFDIISEELVTMSTVLPTACASMGVAVVDTDIYVFGGETSTTYHNSYSGTYPILKKCTYATRLRCNNIIIDSNLETNLFDILDDDNLLEIGVTAVYRGSEYDIAQKVDTYLYRDGVWTLI